MKKEISTEDFAKVIFDAIYEERFLSKDVIVPKVRTLAKIHRLKIEAQNYNAIENPTKTANLMRSHQKMDFERKFWLEKLRGVLPKGDIENLYLELNEQQKEAGF